MTNMHTRIERSSERLVAKGLRLREMLADGRIDSDEIEELAGLPDELLDEAVEVEDISLDVACAKQVLTLGREAAPNRSLRERDERIALLRSLHPARNGTHQKAPSRGNLVEAGSH